MDKKFAVAIIPAKGTSRGLPGKNKRFLYGKPLFLWSVEQALAVKSISAVIVSSDDEDILRETILAGATPILRPPELCADNSSVEGVVIHALSSFTPSPDIVVILQPTSPCRSSEDIRKAIEMLGTGYNSVLSVCHSHRFVWENGKPVNYNYEYRPDRQNVHQFMENGSIYASVWKQPYERLYGKIGFLIMGYWSQFEIDAQEDWDLVEFALIKRGLVASSR